MSELKRRPQPKPNPVADIDSNQLYTRDDLEYHHVADFLGSGGFADVYRTRITGTGTTRAGTTVAAKVFVHQRGDSEPGGLTKGELYHLRKEAAILLRIPKHRNIVQFVGLCEAPKHYALLLEYIDGPSLNDVLHHLNDPDIKPWNVRLDVALQIAEGMGHLHTLTPPIVHLDLKPPNVLTKKKGKTFVCKITDFGLAKVRDISSRSGSSKDSSSERRPGGTVMYIAPERYVASVNIAEEPEKAMAADAYSYGVILWEIRERKPPFSGEMATVQHHIVRRGRATPDPQIPAPPGYEMLHEKCCSKDPNQRPAFLVIKKRLQIILDNLYKQAGESAEDSRDLFLVVTSQISQPLLSLSNQGSAMENDQKARSVQEMERWLEEIKMTEHRKKLLESGYDSLDIIRTLNNDDLQEIGILKHGHRRKILLGVKSLSMTSDNVEKVLAASPDDGQTPALSTDDESGSFSLMSEGESLESIDSAFGLEYKNPHKLIVAPSEMSVQSSEERPYMAKIEINAFLHSEWDIQEIETAFVRFWMIVNEKKPKLLGAFSLESESTKINGSDLEHEYFRSHRRESHRREPHLKLHGNVQLPSRHLTGKLLYRYSVRRSRSTAEEVEVVRPGTKASFRVLKISSDQRSAKESIVTYDNVVRGKRLCLIHPRTSHSIARNYDQYSSHQMWRMRGRSFGFEDEYDVDKPATYSSFNLEDALKAWFPALQDIAVVGGLNNSAILSPEQAIDQAIAVLQQLMTMQYLTERGTVEEVSWPVPKPVVTQILLACLTSHLRKLQDRRRADLFPLPGTNHGNTYKESVQRVATSLVITVIAVHFNTSQGKTLFSDEFCDVLSQCLVMNPDVEHRCCLEQEAIARNFKDVKRVFSSVQTICMERLSFAAERSKSSSYMRYRDNDPFYYPEEEEDDYESRFAYASGAYFDLAPRRQRNAFQSSGKSLTAWLNVVPLLHFLSEQCRPFQSLSSLLLTKGSDEWWGLGSFLPLSTETFLSSLSDVGQITKRLELFDADPLFARTLFCIAPFDQLQSIVNSCFSDLLEAIAALSQKLEKQKPKNQEGVLDALINGITSLLFSRHGSGINEGDIQCSADRLRAGVCEVVELFSRVARLIKSPASVLSAVKLLYAYFKVFGSCQQKSWTEFMATEDREIVEKCQQQFVDTLLLWVDDILNAPEKIDTKTFRGVLNVVSLLLQKRSAADNFSFNLSSVSSVTDKLTQLFQNTKSEILLEIYAVEAEVEFAPEIVDRLTELSENILTDVAQGSMSPQATKFDVLFLKRSDWISEDTVAETAVASKQGTGSTKKWAIANIERQPRVRPGTPQKKNRQKKSNPAQRQSSTPVHAAQEMLYKAVSVLESSPLLVNLGSEVVIQRLLEYQKIHTILNELEKEGTKGDTSDLNFRAVVGQATNSDFIIVFFEIPRRLKTSLRNLDNLKSSSVYRKHWDGFFANFCQSPSGNSKEFFIQDLKSGIFEETLAKWKSVCISLREGLSVKEVTDVFAGVSNIPDELECVKSWILSNQDLASYKYHRQWSTGSSPIPIESRPFITPKQVALSCKLMSINVKAQSLKKVVSLVIRGVLRFDSGLSPILKWDDLISSSFQDIEEIFPAETMSSIVSFLSQVTPDQAKALDCFSESPKLVSWLCRNFKDFTSLLTFVEEAITSPQASLERNGKEKLKNLQYTCAVFAPLIFGLQDALTMAGLEEKCKQTFRNLRDLRETAYEKLLGWKDLEDSVKFFNRLFRK